MQRVKVLVFSDTNEAIIAYQNGYVHFHTRIAVPAGSLNNQHLRKNKTISLLLTTVGKVNFQRNFAGIIPVH